MAFIIQVSNKENDTLKNVERSKIMAKYITRSAEYRKVTVKYANFETMEFVETTVIVESPMDDEHMLKVQVSEVLGMPVESFKVMSKEPTVKEYRRMDMATWLKYSEVFEPKYPRQ